ncbi:hypothetical protein NKG05_10190 [Oerskovia sp. M15]
MIGKAGSDEHHTPHPAPLGPLDPRRGRGPRALRGLGRDDRDRRPESRAARGALRGVDQRARDRRPRAARHPADRLSLPLGLGADVTVKEIPADLTAVDQATTLAGLTGDLEGYLQFFSGPEESIGHAVRALIVDALRRTGFAILVVGAAAPSGTGCSARPDGAS